MNSDDRKFMQRAIQLGLCGESATAPNPMVGAVIVCEGQIVGEGYHRRCGEAHAEVNAVASARANGQWRATRQGKEGKEFDGCTMYVTLEPCSHWGKTPPCCDMIVECGFSRVVVGMQDPNAKVNGEGIRRIREAGIEVVVGVLEEQCKAMNPCFFTYHSLRRPRVTLKWAQTSDGTMGCTMPEGQRLRISSHFTEMLVHRLRARCQAIMVGTNTMLADRPSLATRLWRGASPLRVTIDRRGRLSKQVSAESEELGVGLAQAPAPETLVYGNEILGEILFDLHKRGVQHLLVEGGSKLLQSFVNEGLWDEARVEVHPDADSRLVPASVEGRVVAPMLTNAKLRNEQEVDGNKVLIFINTRRI